MESGTFGFVMINWIDLTQLDSLLLTRQELAGVHPILILTDYNPSQLSINQLAMVDPFVGLSATKLILLEQFLGQFQVVDDKQVLGPEADGGEVVPGDPAVQAPVHHPSAQAEEGERAEQWDCWGARGESPSPHYCTLHTDW